MRIPNPRERSLLSNLFWKKSPIPSQMSAVIIAANRNLGSLWMAGLEMSPSEPMSELIAMRTREVASADRTGYPSSRVSAGTIRNPPPAPTSPASVPMKTQMIPIRIYDGCGVITDRTSKVSMYRLQAIEHPDPSMMSENTINSPTPSETPAISCGRCGMMNCRAK